jgi:hypothetical protein
VLNLSWAKLVRTRSAVDVIEGLAEVVGQWVRCGDGVLAGLDLDGAVAAGGLDELANGPARLVLDPAADCQSGEHDGQVCFDRVSGAVVDGLCRRSDYADAGVLMPARPGYAGRGSRHSQAREHA